MERLSAAGRFVAIVYPVFAESYSLVVRRLGIGYAHRWLHEVLDGSVLLNPELPTIRRPSSLSWRIRTKSSHCLSYDRHFDLMGSKRWR